MSSHGWQALRRRRLLNILDDIQRKREQGLPVDPEKLKDASELVRAIEIENGTEVVSQFSIVAQSGLTQVASVQRIGGLDIIARAPLQLPDADTDDSLDGLRRAVREPESNDEMSSVPAVSASSERVPGSVRGTSGDVLTGNKVLERTLAPIFDDAKIHWFWSIEGFRPYIQSISGSETEGRELSLGLLVVRSSGAPPHATKFWFSEECPDVADKLREILSRPAGSVSSDSVKRILIDLAPFYPGGAGRPLLVLNHNDRTGDLSVVGGRIYAAADTSIRDTHELYRRLTGQGPGSGGVTIVWIKPARSVRVYYGGELRLHTIVARQEQMRRYREPHVFAGFLRDQMSKRRIVGKSVPRDLDMLVERIMAVAIELSEERLGGAMYIMPKKEFEMAFDKLRQSGRRIRISAGHVVRGHSRNEVYLQNLPFGTLLQMVREDGSAIVSPSGEVLAIRCYFDGVGGRRKTAEYICSRRGDKSAAEYELIPVCAIVISQDGEVLLTGDDVSHAWGLTEG